ncbi:MAG: DUF4065 domain-containing protein [Armatimonadota bacterium]|nr:DUF4065 domain-containing protein [Armatimonadota bacterium]
MLKAKDVAEYFLAAVDDNAGEGITNLKLQKLVYYAQGVYLAAYGELLFSEPIEAWAHGPVVPSLYHDYKKYGTRAIPRPTQLDLSRFSAEVQQVLDEVYNVFGQFSAWKLRNMTHEESPWKDTPPNCVISEESLLKYFKKIVRHG